MKALVYRSAHPKKVQLEEVPTPQPGAGEVLVRINAAALNHRDQWIREDKYPNIRDGIILGSDACGKVEKLGQGVDKSWSGKTIVINPNMDWGTDPKVQSRAYKIIGMPDNGTLAEYISIPADRLALKPEHLSDEEAAALPLGGVTAYRALFTHGNLKSGQKVLISGASGGVAQLAVVFAMAAGAQVYITSGSKEKVIKWKALGVKEGYNYKETDWFKKAMQQTGGFDLVIDSAGGDQINTFLKIMRPAGKIVFYGATTGLPASLDLHRMFWNQITLQGSTMGNDEEFHAMLQFVEKNKIKPIIDSMRPLDEVIAALDLMKSATQLGKIIIKCK